MVRIRDVAWAPGGRLVLAGARPASADPITFTGNVANGFHAANTSDVVHGSTTADQQRCQYHRATRASAGVQHQPNGWVRAGPIMQNIWINYNASDRHDVRRDRGLQERLRPVRDLRRR